MKILNVEQGSPEWFAERRCVLTGSKMDDVMGTPLAQAQLIAELIAERATEQTKMIRLTQEMERGTEEEIFAIKEFEKQTKKKVVQGGMWASDEFDCVKHSPDGSIYDEFGCVIEAVEVKNPNTSTGMFYRMTNLVGMESLGLGTWSRPTKEKPESTFTPSSKNPFIGIPAEYKWQVVNYFLVNRNLKKLYFIVYDSRIIDESKKLYVVDVDCKNRELQQAVKELEEGVISFIKKWKMCEEAILPSNF